jgi:hypothetical protein
VSIFIRREMTLCSRACNSLPMGAYASTNAGEPSAPYRYNPPSTRQCR